MDDEKLQPNRTHGMAVAVFFCSLIAQNLVSLLLLGAYSKGILPLIECGVLASLWRSCKLNIAAVVGIALISGVAFSMIGIWAYRTRYGL